jgi:hypothetical protein
MLRCSLAILLIALAVSPFAAPFSTCELALASPFHSESGSVSADKLTETFSAIPSVVLTNDLLGYAGLCTPSASSSTTDVTMPSVLVLRL